MIGGNSIIIADYINKDGDRKLNRAESVYVEQVVILRRFKKELYEYTITNTPTANLRAVSIEDEHIKDDDLVLAIGKASAFGLKGLRNCA